MDSPYHPHRAGRAVEHGGASAAAIAASPALADALLQFPVAGQYVSSLHPFFSRLLGALLLPDRSLSSAQLPSQGSFHSQESLEWQGGGSHSQLLPACVSPTAFLCCH